MNDIKNILWVINGVITEQSKLTLNQRLSQRPVWQFYRLVDD